MFHECSSSAPGTRFSMVAESPKQVEIVRKGSKKDKNRRLF